MLGFVARRAGQAALTVLLVMTLSFFLIRLAPGDPFSATLENPMLSEAVRERWRTAAGLDRPMLEQYLRYVGNAARGDFGPSFSKGRSVRAELADALPNTLLLMSVALLASFAVGIAAGVWQGIRRGTLVDRVVGAISLFFYSMPDFWLALMLLLGLGYEARLFPIGGLVDAVTYDYLGFWGRVGDRLHHLALPAITLTLLSAAAIARYQRAAVLDVTTQDFVRTARAKGLPSRRIVMRHILRNALLPVITLLGLAFPALLGGAVFIEKVFAWPGMGLLAVEAVASRDYYLVTASVVVGSMMVAAGSFLADLLYAVVDPRLREH